MATGNLNAVDDTDDAEIVAKFRMMQQDFLTLSRLYNYAANYNLEVGDEQGTQPTDFTQIADNFAAQYTTLASTTGTQPEDYREAAAAAVGDLGEVEREIYGVWDKVNFLRNAELGLGIMIDGQNSLQIPAEPFYIDGGWDMPDLSANVQRARHVPCHFNPTDQKDYAAFAQFYKLMPLILPRSRRIIALGPGGMLCEFGSNTYWPFFITPSTIFSRLNTVFPVLEMPELRRWDVNVNLVELTPDYKKHCLVSKDKKIELYPIPFSAAKGLGHRWKGQSVSTNIGADESLQEKLETLASNLEKPGMTTWSFSSESLQDDWSGNKPYSRRGLRKQYSGIITEPGGAF